MATIAVSFCPSPVNGWWLRRCTTPFAALDDSVTPCSWRTATLEVSDGPHRLRTFVRYHRLVPGDLAEGTLALTTGGQDVVRVEVRNGITNGSPFTPRLVG